MHQIVLVIQIVVSIAVISVILLQAKGVGLGRAWGGGGEFYKSRRGVEKFIFQLTVFFIIIFLITSVLNLFLS
ncbi:preprotein translocase subunit SecG [Candidatus Gottesmanbacteria bacterium CG11_big_fil_rev_8_21_14_0_20_37_11]|uniref:Protein-export membrane protein SecG n=3 Tax=Candidatus Gottesmaniibacteriota TaxID=1752720 RepID=A0A2M7RPJ7_9BACT|nr:MAG: preprotein translocase subunit SecG [Candidatus Gottesmanbacteria bacterium CG1_02_37_22]PIP32143.1 MAG: preprotein translocase subunit SecG [Candidatus Gottesmanbacteria bacterium CG23_combo_of_CG06-09_8_20_14_all_37_19]PIR08912.1 MAG: preprotein translocase subunit SecG [Candidatus Gottesmanbacteria bacterium CG11_big_fil_rev_8_21_14_0_20_37_11]PIZ02233.1 MAG: preprotein translocase subunit SecG [Candidatus Gottesmanbacteria bacterium CG_4_10_14_0_8_um_filter_37_24]